MCVSLNLLFKKQTNLHPSNACSCPFSRCSQVNLLSSGFFYPQALQAALHFPGLPRSVSRKALSLTVVPMGSGAAGPAVPPHCTQCWAGQGRVGTGQAVCCCSLQLVSHWCSTASQTFKRQKQKYSETPWNLLTPDLYFLHSVLLCEPSEGQCPGSLVRIPVSRQPSGLLHDVLSLSGLSLYKLVGLVFSSGGHTRSL